MGLFNSIIADLTCPVTDEVSKDTEIQIKWQSVDARVLKTYHLGDTLEQDVLASRLLAELAAENEFDRAIVASAGKLAVLAREALAEHDARVLKFH